ncbi:MAG: SOS response-associated peptidase [Bacteroidia bacterium]|nr:SOS response-associated peptidase [Bacteroidia bacterium]
MCFHSRLTHPVHQIKEKFRLEAVADIPAGFRYGDFNAFEFPWLPVICNDEPRRLLFAHWGLIPPRAKDEEIRKYTLNARSETLQQKPAFKSCIQNRCLIPADGFYEWKWLDEKGKKKEKYLLKVGEGALFAFGGLWSDWADSKTGEIIRTFTILTMAANELMSEIHNSKKRMPLVFEPEEGLRWLGGIDSVISAELVPLKL